MGDDRTELGIMKFEGSHIPLAAGLLSMAGVGVGMLLFALGVKAEAVVVGKIVAGWGGVVLLALVAGLCVEFWPKRKENG